MHALSPSSPTSSSCATSSSPHDALPSYYYGRASAAPAPPPQPQSSSSSLHAHDHIHTTTAAASDADDMVLDYSGQLSSSDSLSGDEYSADTASLHHHHLVSPSSTTATTTTTSKLSSAHVATAPSPSSSSSSQSATASAAAAAAAAAARRRRIKPPVPYPMLIAQCLMAAPNQCLTLRELYANIQARFPDVYNEQDPSSWQNTVRYNLSRSGIFVRTRYSRRVLATVSASLTPPASSSPSSRSVPCETASASLPAPVIHNKGSYWSIRKEWQQKIARDGMQVLEPIGDARRSRGMTLTSPEPAANHLAASPSMPVDHTAPPLLANVAPSAEQLSSGRPMHPLVQPSQSHTASPTATIPPQPRQPRPLSMPSSSAWSRSSSQQQQQQQPARQQSPLSYEGRRHAHQHHAFHTHHSHPYYAPALRNPSPPRSSHYYAFAPTDYDMYSRSAPSYSSAFASMSQQSPMQPSLSLRPLSESQYPPSSLAHHHDQVGYVTPLQHPHHRYPPPPHRLSQSQYAQPFLRPPPSNRHSYPSFLPMPPPEPSHRYPTAPASYATSQTTSPVSFDRHDHDYQYYEPRSAASASSSSAAPPPPLSEAKSTATATATSSSSSSRMKIDHLLNP
ncbi:Forkhead box protein K2 [Sorochytrium milnesiophthora]